MLEAIAEVWGPGCSIQSFSIVDHKYHIIGFRPIPDEEQAPEIWKQAPALWILDPTESVISIYPLLPILPGGAPMSNEQEDV